MVSEYVYSPHVDFFIDRVDRDTGYEMASFHIHHKYEIYYEIEGSRRYFIEDAAYIVNAGCVVLARTRFTRLPRWGTRPPAALLRTSAGNTWAKSPTYSRRWISSRS